MVCYSPLTAYRGGSAGVTFNRNDARDPTRPLRLACGQCVGCRLEKSRQWATRCVHEAQMHEYNCFITLTYNNDNLPDDLSLRPEDMTKFWKRLRKKYGKRIRYFYCGEYGERSGRPHYHAIVFNHAFADQTLWKESNGNAVYRSKELEVLWPYGFSSIGAVTFESAAYVARYVMKKRTGDGSTAYYDWTDDDGVVHSRVPEFARMSRRPGIGAGWLEKYKADVYSGDFCIINGSKIRPPRYYDEQLEEEKLRSLKKKRIKNAEKHADNNTPERRRVRERLHIDRAHRLMRPEGKTEL
mgnify:CR=1 FL=1